METKVSRSFSPPHIIICGSQSYIYIRNKYLSSLSLTFYLVEYKQCLKKKQVIRNEILNWNQTNAILALPLKVSKMGSRQVAIPSCFGQNLVWKYHCIGRYRLSCASLHVHTAKYYILSRGNILNIVKKNITISYYKITLNQM